MLEEYAGEVIPALAVAAGGDAFAPYFAGFLPLLLSKLVSVPLSIPPLHGTQVPGSPHPPALH